MQIYDKNHKLYGTFGRCPSTVDEEVVYKDRDGQKLELIPGDLYKDDGRGGILRQSDRKNVDAYIEGVRVIPAGDQIPPIPALTKKSSYLYEVTYDDLDYAFAEEYFKNGPDTFSEGVKPSLCTSA